MTPEEQARVLAEWLDGHPGAEPPPGLDPEVVEAIWALRPDLAPPPRVTADDILAELTAGPLAAEPDSGAAHGGGAAHEAPVVPFPGPEPPIPSRSRRRFTWAWGTAAGTLVALAAAVLLVVRSTGPWLSASAPPPVTSRLAQSTAPTEPEAVGGEVVAHGQLKKAEAAKTPAPSAEGSAPAVAEAPDTGVAPASHPRRQEVEHHALPPPPAPAVAAAPQPAPPPAAAPRPAPSPVAVTASPVAGATPRAVATASPGAAEGATSGMGEGPVRGGVLATPQKAEPTAKGNGATLDSLAPSYAQNIPTTRGYKSGKAQAQGAPPAAAPATPAEPKPATSKSSPAGVDLESEQVATEEAAPAPSGFPAEEVPMKDESGRAGSAPEEVISVEARRVHKPLFGKLREKKRAREVASGSHAAASAPAPAPAPDLGGLRSEAIPTDLSRAALLALTPTPTANAMAGKGQYAQAAQTALSNVAGTSIDSQTSAAQAAAWYLAAGQPQQSLDAARQGLSAATGNDPVIAWLLVFSGDALRAIGDPQAAAESYRQAIQLNAERRPIEADKPAATRPP